MVSPEHDPYVEDADIDFLTGIGCYECDSGWKHSCCSDMCVGCNDAQDCFYGGRPCKNCNPEGDIW